MFASRHRSGGRSSLAHRQPPRGLSEDRNEADGSAVKSGYGVSWVLALQRSAGNAGVSAALHDPSRRSDPEVRPIAHRLAVVQRQPKVDPDAARKAEEAKARKAMKAAFTYQFWRLAEGKGVRPGASGDATIIVNGVAIRILPDQLLTEDEFAAVGGTFKGDHGSAGAVTKWSYDGVDWDPKSLQTMDLGGGTFMVQDYKEPIAKIRIQTTYRKTRKVRTLSAARAQRSAYGKGVLLRDHEASHVADAVAYIRDHGPRLPQLFGMAADDFNKQLKAYFDAAVNLSTEISTYSRGRTDCPGTRNATFCPARPRSKKKRGK